MLRGGGGGWGGMRGGFWFVGGVGVLLNEMGWGMDGWMGDGGVLVELSFLFLLIVFVFTYFLGGCVEELGLGWVRWDGMRI